jgi:hypothetical protein
MLRLYDSVMRSRVMGQSRAKEMKEDAMTTWKGAFLAVLMSGIVVGILNGHLAIWICIGAALGAFLAGRERYRAGGSVEVAKSQNREITQFAGKQ